ncbi:recombination regulator RecX [Lysobacter sp. H21R4]|uniref:recombination regulator RecX n=1 Tax=Lysobacter sp. H21R4 TaxID=2781021 RepID=UPI0018899050|nr:recombination regulator RecX [Lysobacter sp. H21R4]QOY62000.1 recombination regulator RecX [Lysobacter sp. H21R4]
MQDESSNDESGGGLFDTEPGRTTGRRRKREPATPLQRALGLLARREHSRKELTTKLTSRGLDAREVEAAVDKLADAGWQDDNRFAESVVRNRTGSGYGPIHIRAELRMHGLDDDAIAAALDTFEGSWVENARDLVARRYGNAIHDDIAVRRKAADTLMRRGFSGDVVRAATRFDPDDSFGC